VPLARRRNRGGPPGDPPRAPSSDNRLVIQEYLFQRVASEA
jgi:hypothetical protein